MSLRRYANRAKWVRRAYQEPRRKFHRARPLRLLVVPAVVWLWLVGWMLTVLGDVRERKQK